MSYIDKEIACRECGGRFVFTAGEQEFYADKGFTNEPTRCPAQRRARKNGHPLPPGPCPHDVSGAGSTSGASTASRDGAARARTSPPRSAHNPYTGRVPNTPVPARVLRIDPAGRFLFARVEPDGFDVYVHHSLFRDAGLREGDQVRLLVEASDRGPRARSLWVE
ncbi:MAG: DNA-binding protein [Chloroflexales bacterium]|nr:DNA-binding protein [Chloroflexales bacterium]